MRVWSRSLLAAAAGLALVGAAGCSALGGGPTPPAKDELASVDPCKVLTPQELAPYGVNSPGQPRADVPFQPACDYQSDDFEVSFYKDTRYPVDAIHKQAQWAKWDPVDIDGRPGVSAINAGASHASACETMFDAGKGRVSIQVQTNNPGDQSFCQKSEDLARKIAPRMPQKQ